MSLYKSGRIQQMLHYLWKCKVLSTQQAVELFGCGEATIRCDFHYIAKHYSGMTRTHGRLNFDGSTAEKESQFDVRRSLNCLAKREIALTARKLIKEGECFFLDSGSTCLELAKCLHDIKVKVTCNDIKIANQLGAFSNVESYIIGGLIRPGYCLALETLNAFAVDRVFMSCDGLSIEKGITNATMFEVGVKRQLITRSPVVILLADNSKFDIFEPHAVATLSCIKTIVSDSELSIETQQRYRQAGCEILNF